MQGHLGPMDLCLNKLGKGPLGMQCFIRNATVPKCSERGKCFDCFSMYFYGSNLGPPGQGTSWTLGHLFEQTWKRSNHILSVEGEWFLIKRLFNIFLCISMVRI